MRSSVSLLPAAFAAFSCAAKPPRTIHIPDPDPQELKAIKNECDEAEANFRSVLRKQPCNRVVIGAFQEVFRLKCARVVSKSLAEVDWDVEKHLKQCKIYEDADKARQAKCSEASASYKKTLEEALQNDPCKWIFNERQQIDSACAGLLSQKDSADITWEEGVLRGKCGAKLDLDEYLQLPANDECREALYGAELTASWTLYNSGSDICNSDWLARLRQVVQDIEFACKYDLHKPHVHEKVDENRNRAQDFLRICARYNYERQRQ